jgi:hypothetical protein
MCPGSFSYGLNSPERGEGRWAQNYARMLAAAGHEVYAASGWWHGNPMDRHYGVKLLDQTNPGIYGPYDLYFDAAWWKNKQPAALANKYIILKWSLEEYTREEILSDNYYLGQPYPHHHFEFTRGINANKTFSLPTMFKDRLTNEDGWDKNKIFLPGKIDTNRPWWKYVPAITELLNKYPVEACSYPWFKDNLKSIDFHKNESNWFDKLPYDQVMDAVRRCKISLPILNPGMIIETALEGVPSIFWEHGGFYNELARQLDILIESDAPPERLLAIIELLLTNKKKYKEVVIASKDYFSPYTFEGSLKYFNLMLENIL